MICLPPFTYLTLSLPTPQKILYALAIATDFEFLNFPYPLLQDSGPSFITSPAIT